MPEVAKRGIKFCFWALIVLLVGAWMYLMYQSVVDCDNYARGLSVLELQAIIDEKEAIKSK